MSRTLAPQSPPLPVSAIIPAYNSAATIARAVRSAFGQPDAHRPAEVIVVDDHSDDDTAEIAAGLGARVIRHERNRGAAAARNTAVAAARQPWVALLDADDEWLNNRLSSLWPLCDEHVLVSGACASVFDQDPGRAPEYAGTFNAGRTVLRTPADLIPQNVVMASATLVRRDVIQEVGGYDISLPYAEDWDLWLRVLERGTGLLTSEVVVLYHRHRAQKSQHQCGPAEAHRRIVQGCAGRPWWSPRIGRRWEALQRWDAMRGAARTRCPRDCVRLAGRFLLDPRDLLEVAGRRRRARCWERQTERLRRERPSALDEALSAHRCPARPA